MILSKRCLTTLRRAVATALAMSSLAFLPKVNAATFSIPNGDVAALRNAISAANTNDVADIINLASNGTYELTNSVSSTNGPNGLPVIVNDIPGDDLTINGNGATIRRDINAALPAFRLLQTAVGAGVTIKQLKFFGGMAKGSDSGAFNSVGGGILNNGILTLTGCSFSVNDADFSTGAGGAIFNNQGVLDLTNTIFDNNEGPVGGALYSLNGTVSAAGCKFTDNYATLGGAFYSDGTTFLDSAGAITSTFSNCTFEFNSAQDEFGGLGGGAIYNNGDGSAGAAQATLTLTGCTLSFNDTGAEGGAIVNDGTSPGGATLSITNSTISQNRASEGGAIFNEGNASVAITNSTLSENTAEFGAAGILNDADGGTATVTIGNSILNHPGDVGLTNSGGTITSQGFNLSSDSGGGFLTANGDQINKDPKLGPLANNGGPTKTHALLTGSPGIDKGKDLSGTGKDQRGQARPFDQPGIPSATGGDGSDIGAYEAQALPPTISINYVTLSEGNSGTSSATFTVALSAASAQSVTVQYATANDTATAGSDYTAKSGTLTIPAGQISGTITVSILGDTTFEADEVFVINLSNPTNAEIGDGQGAGTITNDDAGPSLSINDVSIGEGNTGTTTLSFTVSLSQASTSPVTVQYATANGTATAGSDYTAKSGTLTIPAGQTSGTITIAVTGDTVAESNDTVLVNLTNPTNATLNDSQGIGTIVNDDAGPSLSINDASVVEGNSNTVNATFTVTLSAASNQTVTVSAIPSNGSARSPADYTAGGVRLSFAPGETTKTFSVPVKGDLLDEANETFFVILSSSINATVARGRGVGTILDDDAAPTISIDDVSIGEGNSGQRSAVFRLKLSAPSGQVVRVSYATVAGTATAGNDYVEVAPTQIAFTTGSSFAYARVLINGDVLTEANETFKVNLSSAVNATIADSQALGTILNDDSAPSLTIDDVTITEGNSGTKTLTFTVTLSKASGQSITVNYATANGTATAGTMAGSDYTAKTGTLTFAAGQVSKTISVTINGDTVVEGNETLLVLLSGAVNASIGKARGVGTITNDDNSG